ncbi:MULTISPECIES: hypothetical protein [Actinoalloteichus]|uniref:hypothetical protein n=1 Tax=Actinoalloteichus TaxID=65496 RepID=UPI0012F99D98|nr:MULTISPECIES: hypothetical protein [Actinoalloteichus]
MSNGDLLLGEDAEDSAFEQLKVLVVRQQKAVPVVLAEPGERTDRAEHRQFQRPFLATMTDEAGKGRVGIRIGVLPNLHAVDGTDQADLGIVRPPVHGRVHEVEVRTAQIAPIRRGDQADDFLEFHSASL